MLAAVLVCVTGALSVVDKPPSAASPSVTSAGDAPALRTYEPWTWTWHSEPRTSGSETPTSAADTSTSPADTTSSAADTATVSASSTPEPTSTPPPDTSTGPATGSGCATSPSTCGYPDDATTGVQAGVSLVKVPSERTSGPGWSYDNQDGVVVTGDGAILSGLDISNGIEVKASNVTISNVRVTTSGDWWGIGLYHANNVTILHTEISSPYKTGAGRLEVGIKDVYGDAIGTKVVATDVWHTSTGIQFNNGLIQDCYIHDMGYLSGDHLNGTTSNAGSDQLLTIAHNTIFNDYDQTDAISLFEDFGAQQNALIANNLLAGGGYTIYGGANAGGAATSNIKIIGNQFSTLYSANSGGYGPIAAFDPLGLGNLWSNNTWIDGPNAGRSITAYGDTG